MTINNLFHQDKWAYQAFRYGLVGLLNTLIGLGTIYCLMFFFHFAPVPANMLGYTVALINSFLLNRSWTFHSPDRGATTFLKFILVFLFSYLIQLSFLYFLLNLHLNNYLAQALATALYAIVGFIGNKHVTFKNEGKNEKKL